MDRRCHGTRVPGSLEAIPLRLSREHNVSVEQNIYLFINIFICYTPLHLTPQKASAVNVI